MNRYKYQVLDGNGDLNTGQRVARSEQQLRDDFQQEGLTPVEVEHVERFRPQPISHKRTLARFFRNLSLFLESGMELLPALTQVAGRMENEPLQACVETIINELKQGRSFASALERCQPYFPKEARRIISVGEETGHLERSCDQLNDYYQSQYQFLNQAFTMLMYPAIVLGIGVSVIIFVITFVLPRIVQLFQSQQANLPLVTDLLLAVGWPFAGQRIWVTAGILLAGVATLIWFVRSSTGQRLGHWILNRFSLYRRMKTQLFCLSMAICSGVGMEVTRALQLSGNVFSAPYQQKRITDIREAVQSGHSLVESFRRAGMEFIPLDSLEAGERSGNLSRVFQFQSELLREEVNEDLERLVALAEPIMVLLLAFGVGLVVAGVMLPVFQLSGQL